MEQFQLKPTIFFGSDALAALEGLAGRRVMVITDSFLAQSGLLERVRARLRDCTVEVFDQVVPDPPLELVAQGARALAEFRPQAVVAFGGGSPMDCAKAMLEFGKKLGAGADIRFVAVPTTAGTGSEVDAGGVLSCEDNDEKLRLGDPRLFPVLSIVDPELMVSVPARLTAYQGFDALFHCVECYISNTNTPMGDMVCREGIRRAAAALPTCINNGDDLEARSSLAFANTLGGYAMDASGTTGSHGLEHGMSAHHHDLPHGAGLIMIARAYHTWMIDHGVAPERYIDMARLMGNAAADDPHDFVIELTRLMEACHVADLAMSEWGITVEELPAIAHNALTTNGVLFSHDPVTLTDPDIVEILKLSYR